MLLPVWLLLLLLLVQISAGDDAAADNVDDAAVTVFAAATFVKPLEFFLFYSQSLRLSPTGSGKLLQFGWLICLQSRIFFSKFGSK